MDREIQNPPYTVIGHTAIPNPRLSIVMKVGGLRKIIEDLDDEDAVRYTSWSDISDEGEKQTYYSRWTAIIKNKKV